MENFFPNIDLHKVWLNIITFLFQAIQFSQTVLIQTIQFSISIVFVYTQLNVKRVPFKKNSV